MKNSLSSTMLIQNLTPLRACVLIAILTSVLTIPWLGLKDFSTRGEPREAIVAQSMLQSGDWLLGSGYGDKVPSKPPLAHWVMLIFSVPIGEVNVFSARLGSALAFVVFAIFFQYFLQKRLSVEQALLVNFTLMGSIEWLRAAMTCRVDMLLSVLIAIGLLTLYSWYEARFKGIPIAAIVLFALATLAKGPVAIVLPGAIFAAFLLFKREKISQIILKCTIVFLPALILGSLWFIYAFLSDERFANKFIYENIQRFLSTTEDSPHKHGFFYLIGTLILGLVPWILLSAVELIRSLRRLCDRQNSFELFSVLVIIGYLVFFSIPSSKRSVYLLPLYPFAAYFMAKLALNMRATRCFVALTSLLMLVLILASFLPGHMFEPYALKFNILPYFQALNNSSGWYWLVLVFAFSCFVLTRREIPQLQIYALVFAIYLSLHAYLLPLFSNALSPLPFAQRSMPLLGADKLYSFQGEFFGLSFYLKKRIFDTDGSAVQKGDRIFVHTRNIDRLKAQLGPSLGLKVLLNSGYGMDKPGDLVDLVEVVSIADIAS